MAHTFNSAASNICKQLEIEGYSAIGLLYMYVYIFLAWFTLKTVILYLPCYKYAIVAFLDA